MKKKLLMLLAIVCVGSFGLAEARRYNKANGQENAAADMVVDQENASADMADMNGAADMATDTSMKKNGRKRKRDVMTSKDCSPCQTVSIDKVDEVAVCHKEEKAIDCYDEVARCETITKTRTVCHQVPEYEEVCQYRTVTQEIPYWVKKVKIKEECCEVPYEEKRIVIDRVPRKVCDTETKYTVEKVPSTICKQCCLNTKACPSEAACPAA